MRITEGQLRRVIEEFVSKKSPPKLYLRFGDPRAVEGGQSVIHDPYAYAHSEEPGLWSPDPDGPPLQQHEKGVSAYAVVARQPRGITFLAPAQNFKGQVNGFLFDRIVDDEAWIFSGRQIPDTWGTDGEPLVDPTSITSPRRISTSILWCVSQAGALPVRLLDLVDPWDLRMHYDSGYNEFLRRNPNEIKREEIDEMFKDLLDRFSLPEQRRGLEKMWAMWIEQWEEDHPTVSSQNKISTEKQMRVTESQLRKLVKRLIKEAPLADIDPPTGFQKEPITGRTYQKYVGYDPEKNGVIMQDTPYTNVKNPKADMMKSIVSSSRFRTKLEKMTANMPINFYVAPYVAENFLEGTLYDLELTGNAGSQGNRAKFGSPSEVIEALNKSTHVSDEDKKLFIATIDKYVAASGGGKSSCLIIPVLRGAGSFEFFTPWMLFHILFDSGDEEITKDGFKKHIFGSDKLRYAIRAAIHIMQSKLRLSFEEIEKIFTMGSARSGWTSRFSPGAQGLGGNTVLLDLANEAATQALTTKGFNYNREAFAEIEKKKSKSPKAVAEVKKRLDLAESLSERVKSAFMKSVAGKVIIVQGTRRLT